LGTDYAIVKYLQENYYNTGRVEYGVVGYNNKRETIIDKTNRSWIEIWLQGYKGNRLDVMVGNYSSFIIFPQKENICLGLKRQGEKYRPTNDFYRDTVFDVACDVKSFIMRKG
jgi:hypothetical protein